MISFSSHSEATDTDELTLIADEHPGIWMAEQTFLSMIREEIRTTGGHSASP